MAIVKNNPFPGLDYTQYRSWKPVTLPSGQVVYEIPGNPGYVFDPVASAASGRPTIRPNPQGAISEQQKKQDAQDKQIKLQNQQASPLGQLTPVLEATAGTVGGAYLISKAVSNPQSEAVARLLDAKTAEITGKLPGAQVTQVPQTIPEAAAQGASAPGTSTVTSQASQLGPSSVPLPTNGAVPVGSAPNGGTLMSDGSVTGGSAPLDAAGMPIEQGVTFGNVLAAAAAAHGGYNAIQGIQHGGEGVRSGLTEAGGGVGQLVAGPPGALIGAAAGNMIGYGLQGSGLKNDAALLLGSGGMAAPLVIARHLGFDLMHKTVAQTQNARLKNVSDITGAPTDLGQFGKTKEQLVADAKANGGNAKFAESRNEADLTPDDTLEGIQNYELVGNDYKGKWNDAQRRRFQELNLGAGNIREKKGGLYFNDQDKALQFKEQVDKEGGMAIGPAAKTNAQAAAQGATQPTKPVVIVNPAPQKVPTFARR